MTKETKDLGAAAPRSLTDSELDSLDKLLSERTAGEWKLWGMDVMADQDGTSNVETAKLVARTFDPHRPHARTFDASLICRLVNAAPSLISELRRWRDEDAREAKYEAISARCSRMEAAIRWVTGEQPLADGRWFDEREFGHERSAPRYWWRSVLRRYSRIDEWNAAQPPPDSSAALLEARRLLDRIIADDYLAGGMRARIRAFLRSDSERSEPARSESGGSKVVHDPSEEER